MKDKYLLVMFLFFTLPTFGQKMFHKNEVLEDLQYLRESLEQAHYNLYTYITKEAFNKNYDRVRSSINADSLSLLEATSLFQSVISKANNGHTEIPFPVSSYSEYANAGGTLFPLDLAFENGKALIRQNLSDNNEISVGAEVISINGMDVSQILKRIFPLISAEREYFKLAKMELFSFPRYYWQAWGQKDIYEVVIKNEEGINTYQLNGVSVDYFNSNRNEIFYFFREFKFLENSAYLKPGNFSGDESEYRNFIDSAFIEINKMNLPNLIIDLRNNLGGNEPFSDYMVSYFADQAFKWNSEFTLKTSQILKDHAKKNYDITQPYWKSIMENKNGSIYPFEFEKHLPQAEEKRYSGRVYVLINRQSHSQSAVTAAQIQDYGFATIVGEETGDFPSLLASQYGYFLPNTGVEVKISKGYIVRVNGSKKAEGVIPDICIKDHLLDERDEVLDGLLKLIK